MNKQSAARKNPLGFFIFLFFIVVLPLATFFFSKNGLDVYKEINKEMRFHNDSIRIDLDHMAVFNKETDSLRNIDMKSKMILVAFWNKGEDFYSTIQAINKLKAKLNKDDQSKMLMIVHTRGLEADSTWDFMTYVNQWDLDTTECKIVREEGDWERYQFKQKPQSNWVVLLDGRVHKNDDTDNYLKGPILCDLYDLNKEEERQKLLRNMVIILPKKQRKSIEYKADKKLF